MTYKIADHERLSEDKYLPYGTQWIEQDDIDAVVSVLKGDWLTQGPKIKEFESQMAEYCGSKYAVAVATGTAALHCAAFAAGVSPGDEAITSPISFVASSNCIAYLGARPVFADIDPKTITCDPETISQRITDKTKAIIPVDFAGHPADMDSIMQIAKKNNLIVIEDAAHSLGATYKGKRVGSLADMTIMSFHPVKHIACGEGGMVLTDDKELCERLQLFRTHGITNQPKDLINEADGPWYYEMQELGFNYRITDMQCALGLSQLSKLDRFVDRRRKIAGMYDSAFSEIDDLVATPIELSDVESSYHLYVLQLRLDRLKLSHADCFRKLRERFIGVGVHYIPIHLHPFYQREYGFKKGDYPHAERYYESCLSIPMYPRMSDSDVERVIREVKEILEAARI